jgi:hypothetical protein
VLTFPNRDVDIVWQHKRTRRRQRVKGVNYG